MSYKIIRFYQSGKDSEVMNTGLTLKEAKEHCKDKETSSCTCEEPENVKRTEKYGNWFDGYTEE